MNAAHTPGPWVVNPIQLNQIATADAKREIARATVLDNHYETIANAALIAESPALLAQLETMVAAFLTYAPKTDGAEYNCVLEARALIAKIKGGA